MDFLTPIEIVFQILLQLWPVWLALFIVFAVSIKYKARLDLYGHLFDNWSGRVGLFLVGFWVFSALFADLIVLFDPLGQIVTMKNSLPGAVEPQSAEPYLLGGDKLARDIFSRMIAGAQIVLVIAPAATVFAIMVGVSLGLPAGYYGGRTDTILSFLANLVLAFPVILMFYLLVTPGIRETGIPNAMAGFFFIFPIIFFLALFYTRYKHNLKKFAVRAAVTIALGGWVYVGLVFDADPLNVFSITSNELNIFVAVVFASSPGVFRIVRGLTLDISTRDYVAAAQTRGESPWYIMLWEILPNARGPLIVDSCLRVGYTTILLGTLGYFGLGMAPESPDWGTAIKDGSRLLRLYVHPVLPPVIALMSFVLGLNLLADALREEALKD